jgi:hypothetical protein
VDAAGVRAFRLMCHLRGLLLFLLVGRWSCGQSKGEAGKLERVCDIGMAVRFN